MWVVVQPDNLVIPIRGNSDVRIGHGAARSVTRPRMQIRYTVGFTYPPLASC
jgi:hypothetical protein